MEANGLKNAMSFSYMEYVRRKLNLLLILGIPPASCFPDIHMRYAKLSGSQRAYKKIQGK